jgi:hypothetical protein
MGVIAGTTASPSSSAIEFCDRSINYAAR